MLMRGASADSLAALTDELGQTRGLLSRLAARVTGGAEGDGSDGGRTAPDTFSWFLAGPSDLVICQSPTPGGPISRGNLTLRDGA